MNMLDRSWRHCLALSYVALLAAGADPVSAQYDRDGRYVPSPMGVPADPYARPIPNYSGKPGAAKGTPIWPRGTPSDPPPAMLPRVEVPVTRSTRNLPVVLDAEICREGWSSATGYARVEFNRRCRRILAR